jgi:hypothetical protein
MTSAGICDAFIGSTPWRTGNRHPPDLALSFVIVGS